MNTNQELSQLVHDVEHGQTENKHLDLLKERINSAMESLNLVCCTNDDRNEAYTLELMGNFRIFYQLVHRVFTWKSGIDEANRTRTDCIM